MPPGMLVDSRIIAESLVDLNPYGAFQEGASQIGLELATLQIGTVPPAHLWLRKSGLVGPEGFEPPTKGL